MKWVEALKVWNAAKGGSWCVPKKGTAGHEEVMQLMGGKSLKAPEAEKTVEAKKMPTIVVKKLSAEKKKALKKEIEVFGKVKKTSKEAKIKAFIKKAIAKRRAAKAAEKVLGSKDLMRKISGYNEGQRFRDVLDDIHNAIIRGGGYNLDRLLESTAINTANKYIDYVENFTEYFNTRLWKHLVKWFYEVLCKQEYNQKDKSSYALMSDSAEKFEKIVGGLIDAFDHPGKPQEILREEYLGGYSPDVSLDSLNKLIAPFSGMEADEDIEYEEEDDEEEAIDEDGEPYDVERDYVQTLYITYK